MHKVQNAYIFCHGRNWKFVKRTIMLRRFNYVIMYIYVVPLNNVRFHKCRYVLFGISDSQKQSLCGNSH